MINETLLADVERMEVGEIDVFLKQVVRIRGRKLAPSLPEKESSLLMKINTPFPEEDQVLFEQLIEKRRDEDLNQQEYDALLELSQKREIWESDRVQRMADLAEMQGLTLIEMRDKLGIQAGIPS